MRIVFDEQNRGRHALPEAFLHCLRADGPRLFEPGRAVTVARAPARIDCMGGIADYSGSVVFEGTLGRAAVVAFQPRFDPLLRARSATFAASGRPADAEFDLRRMRRSDGAFESCEKLNDLLTADPDSAWAAYLIGALLVLSKEGLHDLSSGGAFLLWSDVPIGVGIASSAAVEVAALHAAVSHFNIKVEPEYFCALAQMIENRIVGAACGIMDQTTAALGESGRLLAIRCQPCELLGQHELPPHTRIFGVSSRVEHSVAGRAYTRARVSAFMGLKIILEEKRKRGLQTSEQDGYLCNVPPEQYVSEFRHMLPEQLRGAEFLAEYGQTTDPVTRVDPEAVYRVRAGADHPVFENQRVQAFIERMDRARAGDRTALVEAGGLMYASHASYGWNCELGCEETDLLVRLARRHGPERGIYGAKITGGGSGGTVAVLADADAEPLIREIAAGYEETTGLRPDIFDDTSPGAFAFGARRCHLEKE